MSLQSALKWSQAARELKAIEKSCKKLGGVPQRAVTKAAGKGRTVVRKAVRRGVPVRTGALKRGIVSTGERSRLRGKKVYEILFDPKMNDVFQRPVQNPGAAGSKNTRSGHAYYPASMEYGFLTRSKGGGIRYVEGHHFMREAADSSSAAADSAMIDVLNQEIEKEWSKK